jgi:hypothetical protein
MQTPSQNPGRSPETTSAVNPATESTAQVEFGTFAQLRALFSIPRSTAYELEAAGEIKCSRLRKRGNVRGRVLVNFDSVRSYLARCTEEAT